MELRSRPPFRCSDHPHLREPLGEVGLGDEVEPLPGEGLLLSLLRELDLKLDLLFPVVGRKPWVCELASKGLEVLVGQLVSGEVVVDDVRRLDPQKLGCWRHQVVGEVGALDGAVGDAGEDPVRPGVAIGENEDGQR